MQVKHIFVLVSPKQLFTARKDLLSLFRYDCGLKSFLKIIFLKKLLEIELLNSLLGSRSEPEAKELIHECKPKIDTLILSLSNLLMLVNTI